MLNMGEIISQQYAPEKLFSLVTEETGEGILVQASPARSSYPMFDSAAFLELGNSLNFPFTAALSVTQKSQKD